MKLSNLRAGGDSCPSDLALDRVHGGEKLPEVSAHLAGCTTCTLRMKERAQGFDGVEGVDPRKMLAQIRTPSTPRARPRPSRS